MNSKTMMTMTTIVPSPMYMAVPPAAVEVAVSHGQPLQSPCHSGSPRKATCSSEPMNPTNGKHNVREWNLTCATRGAWAPVRLLARDLQGGNDQVFWGGPFVARP